MTCFPFGVCQPSPTFATLFTPSRVAAVLTVANICRLFDSLTSFKPHLHVVQVGAMIHQEAASAKEPQDDFKMGFVLALCYHTEHRESVIYCHVYMLNGLKVASQYVAHVSLSLSGSGLERLCNGLERLLFTSQRHATIPCPPLPSTGADIHAVYKQRQAKTLIHIKFKHFKSLKAKNPFGSSNLPAHMQWLGLQEQHQPRLRM